MSDDRLRTPMEAEDLPSSSEDVVAVATDDPVGASWGYAWQLPLLVLSIALIGAGFWAFRGTTNETDPASLVSAGTRLILEGQDQEAAVVLARASEAIDEHDDPKLRGQLLVGLADLEARRAAADRSDHRILERYEQARALGIELGPEQKARRATALAGLGRFDAAFEELSGGLGDASLEGVRIRILRLLVDRADQGDQALRARLTPVLDQYAAQSGRDYGYSAWAVLASAQLRLDEGNAEEGVEVLMRAMRRLDVDAIPQTPTNWTGRMYAMLGRLWLSAGDQEAARDPLNIALRVLDPSDEYRSRAEASVAWLDFDNGDYDAAIARFDEILATTPDQSTMLEVQLWRAEAYAAIDQHEEAIKGYGFLLSHPAGSTGLPGERLSESISARVRESVERSVPERAITYANLALESAAFKFDREMVSRAAGAHRALGESILRAHSEEPDLREIPLGVVPEFERRKATKHFREAGELYFSIATQLFSDPEHRTEWMHAQYSAAECFDFGADSGRAIQAYVEYLESASEKDLQRARIAFRYARSLHSAGRYTEALDAYDELVERHAGGPYAAKGRVNAARCLISLKQFQAARVRLESIVSGRPGGLRPEAVDYREAKYELGRLLSDMEDWPAAVTTLDEVIRRYPSDTRVPEAAFLLGSAHQELADQLALQVEDSAVTPSRRHAFIAEREVHLREAFTAFSHVIAAYDARSPGSLDHVEADMLRDAAIGRADCKFDLTLYEEAAPLYEALERRYRHEPASLEALIRLVEVWDRLGQPDRAEKAHRQAELRLQQLPESAFDFPASRFDREAWRIWIARRPLRDVRAAGGE